MIILLVLLYLVCISCSILVIVEAFRDEIWKGVVAIIFPLYLYYYTFVEFEHDRKELVLAGVFAAPVLSIVIKMIK